MTEQQKEAIRILNRVLEEERITEDEYFVLIGYVTGSQPPAPLYPYPWMTCYTSFTEEDGDE